VIMKSYLVVLSCLATCFALAFGAGGSSNWKYGDESKWPGDCTTGKRQSPINIETSKATKKTEYKDFILTNFDKMQMNQKFEHTGTTVKLSFDAGMTVQNGDLNGTYNVLQLHFHWSKAASDTGAEHQIDSKKYPLELHIVTQNKQNPSGSELAVLGFVFEVDDKDNKNLETFTGHLDEIKNETTSTNINITLTDLIPSDRKVFYRYLGSLTTPNCTESVVWTVFKTPIKISATQLKAFQDIHFSHGDANFRSVQDLNNRTVHVYGGTGGQPSSATNFGFNIVALLLSSLFFLVKYL